MGWIRILLMFFFFFFFGRYHHQWSYLKIAVTYLKVCFNGILLGGYLLMTSLDTHLLI